LVIEEQFKEMLLQALTNRNEAARELAQETAIKMANNFTEPKLIELLGDFSRTYIENK
jgi:hypothetical protein